MFAVYITGRIKTTQWYCILENMMNWRHSGFNVYCGKAIWPRNQEGLENLARYIIQASFFQKRMTYIAAKDSSDGVAKVICQSKDGNTSKTFNAMDWRVPPLAGPALAHIHNFTPNNQY
jgi:hypothetical protein